MAEKTMVDYSVLEGDTKRFLVLSRAARAYFGSDCIRHTAKLLGLFSTLLRSIVIGSVADEKSYAALTASMKGMHAVRNAEWATTQVEADIRDGEKNGLFDSEKAREILKEIGTDPESVEGVLYSFESILDLLSDVVIADEAEPNETEN